MIACAMCLIVVAAPTTSAITRLPPSGTYLKESNNHVIQYDNVTGATVDLGTSTGSESNSRRCSEPTGWAYAGYNAYDNPAQCGQCDYVPTSTWATVSTYTSGRCASSIEDSAGDTFTSRVNIQLVGGANENWRYAILGGELSSGCTGSTNPICIATFLQGSTVDGSGGCVLPISTAAGTIYYCSSYTPVGDAPGSPGPFRTLSACHDIIAWMDNHGYGDDHHANFCSNEGHGLLTESHILRDTGAFSSVWAQTDYEGTQ